MCLLSSRYHFQCMGNVQGVRDDDCLYPKKNLPSSSPEQFRRSLVYLSGPPPRTSFVHVIIISTSGYYIYAS